MSKRYMKMDEKYKDETDMQIIRQAEMQNSDFFKYNLNNVSVAIMMRNFLYQDGGQWTEIDKSDRTLRAKTCQTLNVCEPIVRKLISEERASDPQCIVIPMDSNLPTKIVKMKTGLHESIIYESNGKMVFAKCYADMIEGGYGQINLCVRPEKTTSFNNVLRYESPEDVLYSYWDSAAKHVNKIDGDYCGNYFFMPKESAEMTYNQKGIESIGLPAYWGTGFVTMMRKDILVLLNHYRRCYGKITMVKLDGGVEMPLKIYNEVKKEIMADYEKQKLQYDALIAQKTLEIQNSDESPDEKSLMMLAMSHMIPEPEMPDIPKIKKRKECMDFYIEHLVLSKNKVLERKILPIKSLPQLYVGGNDKKSLGITTTQPYAANAVVPQRLINYITSEQIDNIGRSFGLRVVAHEDAVQGRENDYKRPTLSNLLEYKSLEDGSGIVPPKFEYVSGVDMGLIQVLQEQMENIKSVLGRYNENLGDQSNAYGYEAILARQLNGDIASGIYPENLNNAIAEAAKICFEWMPYVYDTERGVLIRTPDGKTQFVTLNRPTGEEDELGNLLLENDMRLGSFTIEVYGGLSFATQRLAGMQFLERMMDSDPDLKHDLIDIYLDLSPFAFKNEAIQRLKATNYINPTVIAEEEGKPPPKPKPNPMQELAKLKIISEIRELQAKEFTSKMSAIESIVKLKGQMEEADAKVAQSEIDLMRDTIEAYASGVESEAKTDSLAIESSVSFMQNMLEKEMEHIQSLHMPSIKNNIDTE